jgi:hypothetical protein
MRNLRSLGFYSKYAGLLDNIDELENLDEAFDEAAKEEDLPHEFAEVVSAHKELLGKLLDQVDQSLAQVNGRIEQVLLHKLGSINRLRTRPSKWEIKIRFDLMFPVSTARRPKKTTFEVGLWWHTAHGLVVCCYVWIKCRRAMRPSLVKFFEQLAIREVDDAEYADSDPGTFVLDAIAVNDLVGTDFTLDGLELSERCIQAFNWIDQKRLHQLCKSVGEN